MEMVGTAVERGQSFPLRFRNHGLRRRPRRGLPRRLLQRGRLAGQSRHEVADGPCHPGRTAGGTERLSRAASGRPVRRGSCKGAASPPDGRPSSRSRVGRPRRQEQGHRRGSRPTSTNSSSAKPRQARAVAPNRSPEQAAPRAGRRRGAMALAEIPRLLSERACPASRPPGARSTSNWWTSVPPVTTWARSCPRHRRAFRHGPGPLQSALPSARRKPRSRRA